MSTPPEQPSPSPYQNPAGQGANPGPIPVQPGQPAVGGYGAPVPPQHNPYAQSGPYGPPAAQPAGYYPPMPGMPGAPGMPGGPQGPGGGAGKAVLWSVVGAVVASALWGGGLLLFGKGGTADADLRGYTVQKNLCTTEDISAFKSTYPTDDDDPSKYTAKSASVDEMYCDVGLEMDGSSYADAYLSVEVDLHKKSDPQPEFADSWRTYAQHDDDYKVTTVSGVGDEGYLITEDGTSSRYVTLAVRDGWMTYSMRWSAYDTGDSDDATMPTIDEATEWVKSSTRATLPRLKE